MTAVHTAPFQPVLGDFLGLWTIDRTIRHADGQTARFQGRAEIAPLPSGGAAYAEAGTLILPGGSRVRAERRYHWDDALGIWFDDGRFFHRIPCGGGLARHFCAPDTYAATYRFDDWPAWQVTWTVRGPKKDYEMCSRYCRAAA